MPVNDVEVHEKVKHVRPPAGCYSKPRHAQDTYRTFTGEVIHSIFALAPCRQIGRKLNGEWVDLPECEGCTSPKDGAYIQNARIDIDVESRKFAKADQRIL